MTDPVCRLVVSEAQIGVYRAAVLSLSSAFYSLSAANAIGRNDGMCLCWPRGALCLSTLSELRWDSGGGSRGDPNPLRVRHQELLRGAAFQGRTVATSEPHDFN